MKTSDISARTGSHRPGREKGMAVILVMALLAIILVYIAGNLETLHHLKSDLHLIEQRQVRRLEALSKTNAAVTLSRTNQAATAVSENPLR